MAYDAARHRVVLFGGRECVQGGRWLNDTWEWDGIAWSPGPAAPPALWPRSDHGLVHDARRGTMVLFGGVGQPGHSDGTWEYAGVAWSPGATAPPDLEGRSGHAMAYDQSRGVTVVFGGRDATSFLDDTWEYDGSAWIERFPASSPAVRAYGSMAWSAAVGGALLFGGTDGSHWKDDAWHWDGSDWRPAPAGPPATAYHDLVAVDGRGAIVLIIGSDGNAWEYDGAAWSSGPPTPPELPYQSVDAAAFDGKDVLVFGGALRSNGTFRYTGAGWEGPFEPESPPGEHEGLAVHDDARGRLVLLYGDDGQTWELVGERFEPGVAVPASVVPRRGHAVAFDGARGRTVLFGGETLSGGLLADTWEYDGAAWTAGPGAPAALVPRRGHAMAHDPGRGCTVLFGGEGDSGDRDDTWELGASGWAPGASPGPVPRRYHAMAYHGGRAAVVLFGGIRRSVTLDDVWALDASGWSPGPTVPAALGARAGVSMTHDPSRSVVVLYGGGGTGIDTWELDGTGWVPGGPAPPGMGVLGPIAYVPGIAAVLLYGVTNGYPCDSPMWKYDCVDVAPAMLPAAAAGQPYSTALSATGGTPPYTYQLGSGELPAGLALSPAGVISGTPTAPGATSFVVVALDATGCGGARGYALAVGPAIDVIAGQGLGPPNPNRVRILDASGAPAPVDFLAYSAGTWGVNVSGAGIDPGLEDEVLTAPGPGPVHGPHIRAFRRDGAAVAKVSYYAYGTLRHGANVAGGDLDGDGLAEILSGAGPGDVFGPHVRGWDYDGTAVMPMGGVSFFAFGTPRYGVNVSRGDLDADGEQEILAGPGPGLPFAPLVRAFDLVSGGIAVIGDVNYWAFPVLEYGVNVAGGDVDDDGFAEIAAAPGPGPAIVARFVGHDYDGTLVSPLPGFDRELFRTRYGGRLALGDVAPDGRVDLIAGPGRDPVAFSTVAVVAYDGSALRGAAPSFDPFPQGYGVNLASFAGGW